MNNDELCYYCGQPSTSDEHVPPKCIFFNTITGKINRKGLIKVPSCAVHNSMKQKDDEYFRFLLIMNIQSSGINGSLNIEKFKRALERKPYVFASFIRNPQRVFVQAQDSSIIEETIAYEPDLDRYHKIIRQICIGLYFHTFRKQFTGKIDIAYDGTISLKDKKENQRDMDLLKAFESFDTHFEYQGDNSQIFQYKIIENENKYYIKLLFFQTNVMLVRMIPEKT